MGSWLDETWGIWPIDSDFASGPQSMLNFVKAGGNHAVYQMKNQTQKGNYNWVQVQVEPDWKLRSKTLACRGCSGKKPDMELRRGLFSYSAVIQASDWAALCYSTTLEGLNMRSANKLLKSCHEGLFSCIFVITWNGRGSRVGKHSLMVRNGLFLGQTL